MATTNIKYRIYGFLLVAVTLWCAAFLLVPVLKSGGAGSHIIGYLVRQLFAPVCHQNPMRSFYLIGEPLAVCARCSGIYLGFWLGVVAYPFRFGLQSTTVISRVVLMLALVPMVLDVFVEWVGFFASPRWVHGLTGLIAGIVVAFVIVPGLLSTASWLIEKRSRHGSIS